MSQFNYDFTDFYGLTGGINTVKSAIALGPNEARDAQDIDLFPIGGFSKRNGYLQLNSSAVSANSCTGLYMARYTTSGGTNLALLVNDTKLYKMSSALGGTWTDATNGLTITTGANNIWYFDQLNDITVLSNGVDAPIQVSSAGTATALLSAQAITNFKFPVQSRGYLWYFVPTVSGTVQYDRGYFTAINDPTTVSTNNFVNVAPGQGGTIQGAVDYKTFLYVFKRHGIYQINYQPTQVDSTGTVFPWIQFPSPIVPNVGTQSHRSIVKFTTPETHPTPGQELVFFVDQFGVPRIFDGATTLSFNSKIGFSRDTTITSLSDMDNTRAPYCFSINYPSKNRILFFMSKINSQQDTCWVMDYSNGFSLMRYKYALPFNVGALFEKSDGTFKPYVGDYAGKVHQLDQGSTDNGSPINDYYRTGDTFVKSPNLTTKFYTLNVRGQNGSITQNTKVSYFLNGGDTPFLTDTRSLSNPTTLWGAGPPAMVWGQSNWSLKGLVTPTFEINGVGRTLGVQLESSNKLNDTLLVEGFSLASENLGTSRT